MNTSISLPNWVLGSKIPKVSNQMSLEGLIIRMKSHPLVNGYHIYRAKDFSNCLWESDVEDHPVTDYAMKDIETFFDVIHSEMCKNETSFRRMAFVSGRNYPILTNCAAFPSQLVFPTTTLMNFKNAQHNLESYYDEYLNEHSTATEILQDLNVNLYAFTVTPTATHKVNFFDNDLLLYISVICLPILKVASILLFLHVKSWETDHHVCHLSIEGVLNQLIGSQNYIPQAISSIILSIFARLKIISKSGKINISPSKAPVEDTLFRFICLTYHFQKVYYIAMMNYINRTNNELSWVLNKDVQLLILEFLINDSELAFKLLKFD